MECTLIVNPGSSSKKYALYKESELLFTAKYEKTGDGFAECIEVNNERQKCEAVEATIYETALSTALENAKARGVIESVSDIKKVGLRIVAPHESFLAHKVITDEVEALLRNLSNKAPLHIPPILDELSAIKEALPEATLIGVSDSAFHQTIPEYRRRYSLSGATEAGIKRVGYHGLSVGSIARRLERVFGNGDAKTVVLHVGNGVSVTGLETASSRYTSMGYTPCSGVIMGSRAGDIDPGALVAVLEEKGLSGEEAQKFIQQKGGFVGLVGTNDIRTVLDKESKKDQAAHEAMELYLERLAAEVARAASYLGGVEQIALTATAMERNDELRSRLLKKLEWLGIDLDDKINQSVLGVTQVITKESSKVSVAVIPTDEMGEMVRVCQSF